MHSNWEVPGVNLGFELGPLFLAHCFNWCLFGLLALQVYIYYGSFVNDPLNHKVLGKTSQSTIGIPFYSISNPVYTVFLLDAISIALSTYSGYWVFVTNWGNVEVFHGLGWSWATVPASTGSLAFIVQSFYAYRVWRVSQKKNWFIPVLIIILSGLSCGFSFASAHQVAKLQSFTYIRRFIPSLWLSFGIAADFIVCTTLIYYFTTTKVRFTLTNRLMIRLVLIVVETAIVTIVAASIKLFLIFSRHDNMHLLFCLILPRLYSNALMGSLNSRSSIFGGTQVRESQRRNDLRISNPGSAFSSFFDKKKSPNVSPSYEIDADIESGQVIRYQPLSYADTLSPLPATHSPSTPRNHTSRSPR